MWDFSIGKTIAILFRTMPYILFRMAIFFGITLAYILATGGGAGLGWVVGQMSTEPASWAVWGGVFGLGAVSVALYMLREWLLYMVKAAHIAVMVKAIDGEDLPAGQGQIAYGASIVKDRFAEANVLFVLDQLIKGVLAVITGTLQFFANLIPIGGVQQIVGMINQVIRLSLTYVDEVILAYNIRIGSDNPWETSRQALVLYAQNYGAFLKNAIWLMIFMWVLTAVVFVVAIAPFVGLAALFPGDVTWFGVLIALVFALSFKAAILEPFAICALMQVFFRKIEGQVPDPAWDARLSGLSKKFVDLKNRAAGWIGAGPKPAQV
ncbi:MAG: hypothetical protein U1F24_00440 [Alphaproteobacteria bacterium]